MHLMKKILIAVLPLLFLFGCSSYISRYFYNYELTNNASNKVKQNDEKYGRYNHYFEDDYLKIHLDCTPYEIGFYIQNKKEVPIQIIWDSVKVFSDYLNNEPLEIYHTNKSQENIESPNPSSPEYNDIKQIEFLKKENVNYKTQPSIILGKKDWMDKIVFNKNIYLLPYEMNNKDSLIQKSNKAVGKKITLILPLKINNKIENYSFSFSVEDFSVLSKG